jgi:DNA helicase-2/ATP-dependent DNA helicase PcrA
MSSYRDRLSRKFKDEYAKLNREQKWAVDSIEGPVMVIAGPGTGKTQILAARIGKILLDTDADPSNILLSYLHRCRRGCDEKKAAGIHWTRRL